MRADAKTSPVRLSVIIPNYNHAHYLPEALNSVLAQSVQPERIYVIDDASTDNSLEVLRGFAARNERVEIITVPENRGCVRNYNDLLKRPLGTHAFLLAADDFIFPGTFESGLAMLQRHPEAGFTFGNLVNVHPDGSRNEFRYGLAATPVYVPPDQAPRALRGVGLVGQGFYLLDGLRLAGGFREELRWHTDHFVCMVLAARHGFCYLPQTCGAFRRLPGSYSAIGMDGSRQAELLDRFLERLRSPEFADVRPAFRESHGLAIFNERLLSTLTRRAEDRYFLTASFVARVLKRRLLLPLRHPVPAPLKRRLRALWKSCGSDSAQRSTAHDSGTK